MGYDWEAFQSACEDAEAKASQPKSNGGEKKWKEVPVGEYVLQIKGAGVKVEEGKTPALVFEQYIPSLNANERNYLNMTAGASGFIVEALNTLGVKPRGYHPNEIDKAAKLTVGYTIKAKKYARENKGKTYHNWKYLSVIEKPQTTQAADGDIDF